MFNVNDKVISLCVDNCSDKFFYFVYFWFENEKGEKSDDFLVVLLLI